MSFLDQYQVLLLNTLNTELLNSNARKTDQIHHQRNAIWDEREFAALQIRLKKITEEHLRNAYDREEKYKKEIAELTQKCLEIKSEAKKAYHDLEVELDDMIYNLSKFGLAYDPILKRVIKSPKAQLLEQKQLWQLSDELAELKASLQPIVRQARMTASTQLREQLAGLAPGQHFSDGAGFPEMVILPPGQFLMGSPADEEGSDDSERPQHTVRIDYRFALGRYAVTFDEYDRYARAAGIALPNDSGWGRGRRPVINVSWDDAQAYLAWLNDELGAVSPYAYRLPSEAEWEYACRAGTTGPFNFTEAGRAVPISPERANYEDEIDFDYDEDDSDADSPTRTLREHTVEVGHFPPNAWGLHEMHGNVSEWVEDLFHGNYAGAPDRGQAWTQSDNQCGRVLRSGAVQFYPRDLRSAARNGCDPRVRFDFMGFRIAKTLP